MAISEKDRGRAISPPVNKRLPRLVVAYGGAVALTVATLLLRQALSVSFGERPLLILFMFPILVSALLGGLGPGVVATLVAAGSTNYFLIPPLHSFRIAAAHDALQWSMLLVNGLLVSFMSELLHRSRKSEIDRGLRMAEAIAQLKKSQESYRILAENISDVIWILDLDTSRFRYVSPSVERLRGYTADEVMSQNMEMCLTRASYDYTIDNLHVRLENFKKGDSAYYVDVIEQPCKDGTSVWTETTTHYKCNDETGHLEVYGVSRNIADRKKAEEENQLQKTMLEEMGRIAGVGGWQFDAITGEGVWTDEVARIHDLDPTLPTSRDVGIQYYAEDSREKIIAAVRDAVDKGRSYDLELELVSAKGTRKWVRTIGCPVFEDGRVTRVAGSIQDITERKQAEIAVCESEERFRAVVESSPDAIFIQTNGRFAYANPMALKLFGETDAQHLIGTPVMGQFHPDYRDIVVDRIRRLNVLRESVLRPEERLVQRKDGSSVSAEFSAVPFNYRGEQGALVFARDITDRKEAEIAICESEARFRTLIEGAPEGVFIHSDGVFQYLNPVMVSLLGASKSEDLMGTPFLDRVAPEYRELILERIRFQKETGVPLPSMEQEYLQLDGSNLPVESTAVACHFQGKEGRLVFVRDISSRRKNELEREKLRAQLEQAQKLESIGRLAGGVAHDYNNMLGVIMGFAELAMGRAGGDEKLLSDLKEIRSAAERSAGITRQLLAFARCQAIRPIPLNLNAAVSGMLKMLKRLIGEDIALVWLPKDALWRVRMDPSQVDQILANLCVNARDAIAAVGKISIETDMVVCDEGFCSMHPGALPGEFVLLSVSDDGCGMTKEHLEKIFDPFFTTKEMGRGTGLGLSTVYGIVSQNDGFITVYSEAGQGTTFRIYLPREKQEVVGECLHMINEIPRGHGERILVVEDEPATLKLINRMLMDLGYAVLSTSSPSEGIELAKTQSERIDLLITDVVMPEMNGKQLSEHLAAAVPGLKCLFMSGYTADVIAHRGMLEEGVHFVSKPFSKKDLAVKMREVLQG